MATSTVFTVTNTSLNSSLIAPTPLGGIPVPFHPAVVVILAIVSAVGIIGNLFIIGSVCLYKRLRVRGHAFIVNLALADLLIVAYIMPVGLATSQFVENPFSDMMCEVNGFIILTSLGVSTQTLMLIALERYFHICKMHIYRKAFTPRLIGFYIFVIWIYTAAWTCQGWTGWTFYSYGPHIFLCTFDAKTLSYNICLCFFGMLLPMIIIAVCYYKIFRTVKRSRNALSTHKKKATKKQPGSAAERLHRPEVEKQAEREYRLIVTLVTIVIVFICFWLPASVVIVLTGAFPGIPRVLNKLAVWLALSNSAVNSIIYGLLNHLFRKGYRIVFETVFCCGHMPEACCATTKKPKGPGNKDSTSESHSRSGNTKQTKSSTGLSSQSDASDAKSGASTDTKDITIADSQKNLSPIQSTSNLAGKPPTLTPIQYVEEPESGAAIGKQNSTHVKTHDHSKSEADSTSIAHVSDSHVKPLTLSGSFSNDGGVNSTSQSSLLHKSLLGSEAGSVDIGPFTAASHCNSKTALAQITQGEQVNSTQPPLSAFRPRPTSTQRGMPNVALETKL